MNADLENRLYNFKFESAVRYLTDDEPREVHELVEALASMFGNSGGIPGTLGLVTRHALENIGVNMSV